MSLNGQITVEDGDADGFGVSAATNGRCTAVGTSGCGGELRLLSGSGHVTLRSGDDIDLNGM